jgi:hypothetical protein
VALGRRFIEAARPVGPLGAWEQYAQVLLLSNEFAFME